MPARPPPGELEQKKAEALTHLVRAWETGNFDHLVSMLAEDAILSMPPWVYWLDGRYTAMRLTVLTLGRDGRIVDLAVFVLPEQFKAWGFPSTLESATPPMSPARG